MFVNCSNHNSKNWSEEQLAAAREYGEIYDYPFPVISAEATSKEVAVSAKRIADEMIGLKPDCVMCQGEFTMTNMLVNILKGAGIKVVAGCSERDVIETRKADGSNEKIAVFRFVQFREY